MATKRPSVDVETERALDTALRETTSVRPEYLNFDEKVKIVLEEWSEACVGIDCSIESGDLTEG